MSVEVKGLGSERRQGKTSIPPRQANRLQASCVYCSPSRECLTHLRSPLLSNQEGLRPNAAR